MSQIKVDSTTRRLLTADAPRKISDFDKNALEEATRMRAKHGGEVIALTVSAENASSALREALALGADKAFLVQDPALQNSDTLAVSQILAEAIKKVGPRLAEILGVRAATYARKVGLEGDSLIAERSLEDCSEVVKVKMPALLTVTKEINEPRVPTLMDVLKASKRAYNVDSFKLGSSKGKS